MKKLLIVSLILSAMVLSGCGGCSDEACYKAKAEYELQQKNKQIELEKIRQDALIEKERIQAELYKSEGYVNKKIIEANEQQADSLKYLETSEKVKDAIYVGSTILHLFAN